MSKSHYHTRKVVISLISKTEVPQHQLFLSHPFPKPHGVSISGAAGIVVIDGLYVLARHLILRQALSPGATSDLDGIMIFTNLVAVILGARTLLQTIAHRENRNVTNASIVDGVISFRAGVYTGRTMLPKNVYQDDLQIISLILEHSAQKLQEEREAQQAIEVKLEAAGLRIASEEKQRQPLTLGTLNYRWGCFFNEPGKHQLRLILKAIGPHGEYFIGEIQHEFNVITLGYLAQRQVERLALAFGIASVIITTLGVLGWIF